jgi:GGDEF domain-containing protein
MEVALDRMVQEVQQAMMKQYVLSDVARRLREGLEDYNIIARKNDHFLVLLPEVASEDLPVLAAQLRQAISDQVGVTLQVGISSFPEDAVTFESLLERAVGEMDGERKVEHSARSQQLAAERHTT